MRFIHGVLEVLCDVRLFLPLVTFAQLHSMLLLLLPFKSSSEGLAFKSHPARIFKFAVIRSEYVHDHRERILFMEMSC